MHTTPDARRASQPARTAPARTPDPQTAADTPGFPVGKVLLATAAVFPAVGAFVADWNRTHVFNPQWPPHAKFHNGQTLTAAVELAALGLWQLWGPGRYDRSRVRWATLFGGLYWLTAAPAILFPGAAFVDPDSRRQPTAWRGLPINQVTLQAAVLLPLLAAGYALEARRLRRASAGTEGGPP